MQKLGEIQILDKYKIFSKNLVTIYNAARDVVITNCYSEFHECKVLDETVGDHQLIKCILDHKVTKAPKFRDIDIRNYSKENIENLQRHLDNINFSPLIQNNDIEYVTSSLNEYIGQLHDHFFPYKSIRIHPKFIFKPSKQLLKEIRKKKILYI